MWGSRYLAQEAERKKREAADGGAVTEMATEGGPNVYVKMVEEEKEERKDDTSRSTESFIRDAGS